MMEGSSLTEDKSDEGSIFLDDGDLDDSFEMVCLNGDHSTPIPLETECIDLSDLSKIRSEGGVIVIDSDDDDDDNDDDEDDEDDDDDEADNGAIIEGKDDDDVVFIGSYIQEGGAEKQCQEKNVRRNPMRSARNKLRSHSDLLYEDDLMLLSGSEEVSDKENESPLESSPPTPGPSRRPRQHIPKQWPINVHDRPEYDDLTKQIHPLDRMLREAAAQAQTKPTPAPAQKKRPRLARKRRGRRRRAEPLRPASRLVPQVEATLGAVKKFVEEECSIVTEDQKLQLLRNTMMMLMFVKDCAQEELIRKFQAIDGKSDEQDLSVVSV